MVKPAPFIGIMRHRIGIDGEGVTTLAAFHGCPLQCKYCLNPSCHGLVEVCRTLTPEQLYEEVRIDQLYFLATHGGVCFGGGEPLLRSDFIVRFRELCGPDWQLTLETSLYVPQEQLKSVLPVADYFIVDIKDLHPDIYQKYTARFAVGESEISVSELPYPAGDDTGATHPQLQHRRRQDMERGAINGIRFPKLRPFRVPN